MSAVGTRRRSPSSPSSQRGSRAAVRSVPQESTGPRLRLVGAPRVSGRVVLAWGAALFFVVLAGSVAIQAQRIEAQHRLDRIDAELIAAREQQRQLRAEVAVAESPSQVMQAARGLGMVDPGPVVPLSPLPVDPPAAPAEPPAPADAVAGSAAPAAADPGSTVAAASDS